MLKNILAISGKPGLYRLVSRGNRNLIVETLCANPRRSPAFATDRIISLADIAMYTDEEDVPLHQVLNNIKAHEQAAQVTSINLKTATKDELFQFMDKVLPTFDRDRVHASDVKKLIQWYNILIENGITDFDSEEKKAEETEEQ